MTRRLGLALALGAALAAAPALGATYYVAPGGDSTAAGTSCATAKTLTWANLNIRAGDVCYLCDGTYTEKLQPGNTGTAGSRITFIGDITTPGNVSVPQVQIDSTSAPLGGQACGGFVTVKGVHSRSDIQLKAFGPYDHTDSVLYCTADWGLSLTGRGKATVRYCTFGDAGDFDNSSSILYNETNPYGTTRTEWSHYITGLNILDNTFYVNTTPASGGGNAFKLAGLNNCTFSRNRVYGRVVPTSMTKSIMTWYYTQGMTVADNRFEGVSNSGAESESYLISLRDNQRFNVFERDTFFEVKDNGMEGASKIKVGLAISGNNADGVIDKGDRNVQFHSCFVRVRGRVVVDPSPSYTFRNNTIVTSTSLVLGNYSTGYTDSLEFRHNTVVSFSPTAMVVDPALRDSRITQNIFYSPVDRTSGAMVVYNDGPASGSRCLATPGFADSNLVFSATGADSADAFTSCTRGGSNEALPSVWCTTTGLDCNSRWGAAAFPDSAFWTFNPKPSDVANAKSASWPDGYVGAIDPTRADATPPVLSVSWPASARAIPRNHLLPLAWTASDNVAVTAVKVFRSESASGPWEPVHNAEDILPTDTFAFRVPRTWAETWLYMRVVAYDAAGNSTTSEQAYIVALEESDIQPQRETP